MKILLLGGTGFVGSHLTRVLALDHEVYISSRNRARSVKCTATEESPLGLATGETITSIEFLKQMDAIVPLAAKLGHVECMKDPLGSLWVAPMVVVALLEKLKQLDAKPLIVYPSSHTAHKPGVSPYSLHKWLVEAYLGMHWRAWGVPSTVLRLGTMYGPGQKRPSIVNFYVARGLAGETLPIFEGRERDRLALTYVEDGVFALKEAIEGRIPRTNDGPPHDAVGHCHTLLEIAQAVTELVGGTVQLDAPCSPLAEATNPGDSPVGCQLERHCQWKPTGLREGILKTKEWLDGAS